MEGYTKLFESLLTSSIWELEDKTRLVWITMLALKNSHHMVEASVPGLARMARVDRESVEAALKKFLEPDPDSRSREFDGRRIEEVPGGWLILNGEKYRRLMAEDERRVKNRIYKRDERERKKGGLGPSSCEQIAMKAVEDGRDLADFIPHPRNIQPE